MNLQRASERQPMPWRNGKGVQYEIAADGPLPEGWTWRVSTADIAEDVPFSVYPGVVRDFCVAEGNGVVLTIDGVEHRCGPCSVTRFPGSADVSSRLIDGPVRALNLMQRDTVTRGAWSILLEGETGVVARLIVAIGGSATVRLRDGEFRLEPLDAILECDGAALTVLSGFVAAF
jgi:hypothetical protein